MTKSGESVKTALAVEAESADQVEAALGEVQVGQPSVSLGMLAEAIAKELKSLDLLEQGVASLQLALDERRHALEQQEEILNQLVTRFGDEQ
jgi:hypothetical protein